MKKAAALGLALALALTGCGSGSGGETEGAVELTVFAAASLTETLTELGNAYTDGRENIKIVFNFDSSGTLETQIQEGADCDIFISAAQKQMDELDISAGEGANPQGLDYILPESRLDLLENRVVLAVPEGNPAGIGSFEALKSRLEAGDVLLAVGGPDVPVGQYTRKIFDYMGLDQGALASSGCLTYGSNVKEIVSQVTEGTVDCGIIYRTDAFSAGLETVDTAGSGMCGRAIYPGAVLRGSDNRAEALAFLEFLTGDKADAVFEEAGFAPAA